MSGPSRTRAPFKLNTSDNEDPVSNEKTPTFRTLDSGLKSAIRGP